jgi:hypothetical protein
MMSLSDLATGLITVFVFLNLTTVGWTQSCVITGGIDLGTTTQNCIVVGPARLTFQPAIAEELISKLSPGKPIRLRTVGRDSDQRLLMNMGDIYKVADFKLQSTISPPTQFPIQNIQ